MYSWQLLLSMQSEYFPGGSIVAAAGTEADRLMIIVSGYIRSLYLIIGNMYLWNISAVHPRSNSRLFTIWCYLLSSFWPESFNCSI